MEWCEVTSCRLRLQTIEVVLKGRQFEMHGPLIGIAVASSRDVHILSSLMLTGCRTDGLRKVGALSQVWGLENWMLLCGIAAVSDNALKSESNYDWFGW